MTCRTRPTLTSGRETTRHAKSHPEAVSLSNVAEVALEVARAEVIR